MFTIIRLNFSLKITLLYNNKQNNSLINMSGATAHFSYNFKSNFSPITKRNRSNIVFVVLIGIGSFKLFFVLF
jgi:hypothetical protein